MGQNDWSLWPEGFMRHQSLPHRRIVCGRVVRPISSEPAPSHRPWAHHLPRQGDCPQEFCKTKASGNAVWGRGKEILASSRLPSTTATSRTGVGCNSRPERVILVKVEVYRYSFGGCCP